ncbi:polyribonucleotide nucleotidyltransferase [Patescibacteria group bacterium]|nr:polyribonucleotide nucleotidyltransferase [Patescibacteria group bacterium]MBU1705474.1 polyribonucleotide nucleotidyltransferase [Patescibacteria group bacterium]
MTELKKFETQWGGKTLTISTGKYAEQAHGACLVQYGETVVLATVVMSESAREGVDFFPLMVDYEEKMYAAGRIKGSRFMKREGRAVDEAILTSRFIDRAIRPLFDQSMRNEVQVIVTCLAFDGENDADILGLIGASCALHISQIPWNGPIADIRIGQVDGAWIINPTYEERAKSLLDLAFAGTSENIIMVEAGANEAPEDTVLEAFWYGMENLKEPVALIEKIRQEVGKEKVDLNAPKTDEEKALVIKKEEIAAKARPFIVAQVKELFFGQPQATKTERYQQKTELKKRTEAFLLEQGVDPEEVRYGLDTVIEVLEDEVTREIIENDKRVDGRKITEIRKLVGEVQLLPRVHGSGLFSRGETQVLTVTTLGAPGDEQTMDGMEFMGTKRFFHHYNFPPYSVGEVKPMRGPSRRDIGHGALAEKALAPMIPSKEDFPYTIRLVSETMGSNGSSSMASTCGSTLALMDAGVPIKTPVAGIAMGVATNDKGDWKVLTDIQDLEDGKGGMDFKIAGSREGITAIQMDTKTEGLSREIVEQTFKQAREARMEILDVIQKTIPEPRAEMSPYAPRIITVQIDPAKIGEVIGPGGKMINEIIDTTGVQSIDIEDSGLVMITSIGGEAADKAKAWVERIVKDIEVGEIYKGKVVRLMDFGAFVEILPKKDGMVHVSELAPWRVEKVSDIVKIGDEVNVKVIEIDDKGRVNLSMKQAEGNVYPEKPANAAPSGDRKPYNRDDKKGGFSRFKKPFRK